MAWLSMYLLEKDVELLNTWLNEEEEIAFLVTDGPKKWIAKKEHAIIPDIGTQIIGDRTFAFPNFAKYTLWHIPSGPLPSWKINNEENSVITDPWAGWTELRTGADSTTPYFGPGHPGVIELEIKLSYKKEIPLSGFGWIGNYFRTFGEGAHPSTELFWKKLRKMAKKTGTQIPRTNNPGWKKDVFAFPAAYEEIKNGRPCALNS